MKIRLREGLPYLTASLHYRGRKLRLQNVLLDTGSAGTVFSADKVLAIGIQSEADDLIHRIRGIGGSEFVFTKRIERLSLGDLRIEGFEIEVGAMDYGINIDGIIGIDFLLRVGAMIDLAQLKIYPASPEIPG